MIAQSHMSCLMNIIALSNHRQQIIRDEAMVVTIAITRSPHPAMLSNARLKVSKGVCEFKPRKVTIEIVFPLLKIFVMRKVIRFQHVEITAKDSLRSASRFECLVKFFYEAFLLKKTLLLVEASRWRVYTHNLQPAQCFWKSYGHDSGTQIIDMFGKLSGRYLILACDNHSELIPFRLRDDNFVPV